MNHIIANPRCPLIVYLAPIGGGGDVAYIFEGADEVGIVVESAALGHLAEAQLWVVVEQGL